MDVGAIRHVHLIRQDEAERHQWRKQTGFPPLYGTAEIHSEHISPMCGERSEYNIYIIYCVGFTK